MKEMCCDGGGRGRKFGRGEVGQSGGLIGGGKWRKIALVWPPSSWSPAEPQYHERGMGLTFKATLESSIHKLAGPQSSVTPNFSSQH